jgi:hypothetical protein
MKIADLKNKVEGVIPGGFGFFYGLKSHYNHEKFVKDMVLMIPPRSWPLNFRQGCSYDVDVEFWIGRVRSLKDKSTAISRDQLNDDARTLMDAIGSMDDISVVNDDVSANYWTTDEGQSVNAQEFVSFTLTLRLWTT